ncbi:MAG TPA: ZIP family metal transporter, partial [Bacteroidales bacterium]|nr:ZIP family metal transporter [Bacteroidales bacterium]
MKTDLLSYNPVLLALLATTYTYAVTALGAGMVFFFKSINRKILNSMLGFAAGIMIAASFWSLLKPAIDMAEELKLRPWVPAVVGFLAGGFFILLIDKLLPHLHLGLAREKAEGIKTTWQR